MALILSLNIKIYQTVNGVDCGIVCLTVVLNFLSKSKKYTADDMLERAKEKAYLKNVGWLHEKLIAIANYEGFFGKKVIRLKDRNDLSLER